MAAVAEELAWVYPPLSAAMNLQAATVPLTIACSLGLALILNRPMKGGNALRATIDDILARFSPFSDEWELLSTALNGTSEVLKIDTEGRMVLSEALKAHAGIGDAVTFVGHGHKFQIWEPERFRAHLDAARTRLRDVKRTLGSLTIPTGGAGT